MVKTISGIIVENSGSLTLEQFCRATKIKKEIIIEMVDYQLIQPIGEIPEDWHFDSRSLKRGRIAASFYQDLEVNMEGIALALELLDQIEHLQHQLNLLKKK